MHRTYDIFEMMADGTPIWRAAMPGLEPALARLKEIAAKTTNEVRLMHVPSLSIIAVMNEPKLPSADQRRIDLGRHIP